jgi:choline dehydrogenase-like flavoprotein
MLVLGGLGFLRMTFLSDPPRGRYDAIVVGSGAAGGMSALVLARAGARVLMLEAGRRYDPMSETPMFDLSRDAPLRAVQTPEKAFGYYDATVDGGWTAPGEPYTTAPGSDFRWYRARMLGGRTNHWGRVAVRFGPYDFMGRTRDGLGQDWPIRYEDLAPYYDRTEALIGVFGSMDEVENAPASPPGVLQPPPAPRAYELFVKAGCTALGIPCLPTHCAVLTRPLGDRPACFYATACRRGCAIRANFQSPTVLLPPALATGRFDILTDAMAVEVVVDRAGRAKGVRYIDKRDRREAVVTARATILAAGALDTTRVLLCSRSARFPDGLANGSGQLGRNLVGSPSTTVRAHLAPPVGWTTRTRPTCRRTWPSCACAGTPVG